MMNCRRSVMKLFRPAFAVLLVHCSISLFAREAVSVVPPPGSYASDQLLSITAPRDTRLTVIMNGSRIHDAQTPILLSAEPGEQKSYRVQIELLSLAPGSPSTQSLVYEWIIDKKDPEPPSYLLEQGDSGVRVRMTSNEPVSLQYLMYQPFYQATSRGRATTEDALFLPEGSVLCAYAIDRAGNISEPSSVTAETGTYGGDPVTVENPVPGTWANRQTLVLDTIPGMNIRYTTDGSDPVNGGIPYTGPVLIDQDGTVTIRIAAQRRDGSVWTDSVLYTVREQLSGLESAVTLVDGVYETASFFEKNLPDGFTATLGNPWNSGKPQTSILFSAPEGVRRIYPVTVRRENTFWRWVCAAGSLKNSSGDAVEPHTLDTASAVPAAGDPRPVINDWHFLSITGKYPVFYSHDGKSWMRYDGPIVLGRKRDEVIYWYSPARDNGSVSTVSLPAKPVLSGLPPAFVTADPVFLAVSPSPFTWYYAFGARYAPVAPPETDEYILSSGVLLETPQGASETYTVRLRAVHDGLVHGDLAARFILDRKAPRVPSLGIPGTLTYSREPVSLRITGEDMIQVAIQPDLYDHTGNEWLLTGHPEHPVTYTISSFAVDRAGNRSDRVERTVTVDRNALYVDGTYTGIKSPDGSPDAPFTDLDSALSVVSGRDSWRITVTGPVRLERTHTLRANIQITGINASVTLGENAAIRCFSHSLSLSGLSFTRADLNKRARSMASFPTPFLEIGNGSLTVRSCTINDSLSAAGAIIKSDNSKIVLHDSRFHLDTDQYAAVFDIRNSSFFAQRCRMEASSQVVSAVSISGGRAAFHDSHILVTATGAARALESWGASIVIRDLRLQQTDKDGQNTDTAFWMDQATEIISEQGLETSGFKYKTKTGVR